MRIFKRGCRPGWDRTALAENHVEHSHRSWSRRRDAALRMVSLDCGCGPDPWLCRCTEPPLTDVALAGWRDAAQHLLASGRTPLVPLEVLRELHRRGGDDRSLAETLHAGCGGVIR